MANVIPEYARLHALWRLALSTGLRQAELLGLGWDHIDLDAGTVTVEAQLQRQNGEWVRVPLKSARTLKVLAIDAATVDALRAHKVRQLKERRPEFKFWGMVFTTAQGEPYHGKAILEAWHQACDAAGIRRRRFHSLRHASATLMRELGVAEEVRSARLGHSTASMASHYARASQTQDREAVDALARALAG